MNKYVRAAADDSSSSDDDDDSFLDEEAVITEKYYKSKRESSKKSLGKSFRSSDGNIDSSGDENVVYDSDDDDDGSHRPGPERNEKEEIEKLTKDATLKVQRGRRANIVLLLLAAGAVIGLSYVAFSNGRHQAIQQRMDVATKSIATSTSFQLELLQGASSSLSRTLQLQAANQQQTWPYVTVIDFELATEQLLRTSGAEWIGFSPLIRRKTSEQLDAWSNYSSTLGPIWIQQSLRRSGTVMNQSTPVSVPSRIYRYETGNNNGQLVPVVETPLTDGSAYPLAPVWQLSPVSDVSPASQNVYGVNFNALSRPWLQQPYNAILNSAGHATCLTPGSEAVRLLQLTLDGENATSKEVHPYSMLVYPVVDAQNLVVALIMSILRWGRYLDQILVADDANGLQCVLRSSCDPENEVYTYTIKEQKVEFLGAGDLHNDAYTNWEQVVELTTNTVTAAEDDAGDDCCLYTVSIYPTDAFMQSTPASRSTELAALTMGVLLLFIVVLALAFCLFNRCYAQKYDKLSRHAVKVNTVISTLFPATVRKRLFPDDDDDEGDFDNHAGDPAVATNTFVVGRDQLVNQMKGAVTRVVPGRGNQQDNTFSGGGSSTGDGCDDEDELEHGSGGFKGEPIADFFTETTILFADIVGFTAWSSVREPVHVFKLLETLYHSFDAIAERRGVFKVETVGDCYVAVTGLPEPRPDHATALCRFAHDCMEKMLELVRKLEVELGPDTGDLSMRFGLHSGSVTAGVLRGQRSRFQLFGDTMNTASRMETTSTRGRIQISESTRNYLVDAGKAHWVKKREELVFAKGKGDMQTYWLVIHNHKTKKKIKPAQESAIDDSTDSSDETTNVDEGDELVKMLTTEKMSRIINWTVEVLRKLLQRIQEHRIAKHGEENLTESYPVRQELVFHRDSKAAVLDEVVDSIDFAHPDDLASDAPRNLSEHSNDQQKQQSFQPRLQPEVEIQLQTFVTEIASLYNAENHYHNFEHCAHVVMSAGKMLSRIVEYSPDIASLDNSTSPKKQQRGKKNGYQSNLQAFVESQRERRTSGNGSSRHVLNTSYGTDRKEPNYGITSDPLTVFAFVFSALILDISHKGVSNAQLMKEEPELAAACRKTSVAEQVSVDVAWNLLMEKEYSALRAAIYSNGAEMRQFRQLIVNCVIATDVAGLIDEDESAARARREQRWDQAFASRSSKTSERRTTVIIETIMQATDSAHAMQHWAVYRQWSQRLFDEVSIAYVAGRADRDPADTWYQRELIFFDKHVIPLAKKLKDCGVFGATGEEFLNTAQSNRREWLLKGRSIVASMSGKKSSSDKSLGENSVSILDNQFNESMNSVIFGNQEPKEKAPVDVNISMNVLDSRFQDSMQNLEMALADSSPLASPRKKSRSRSAINFEPGADDGNNGGVESSPRRARRSGPPRRTKSGNSVNLKGLLAPLPVHDTEVSRERPVESPRKASRRSVPRRTKSGTSASPKGFLDLIAPLPADHDDDNDDNDRSMQPSTLESPRRASRRRRPPRRIKSVQASKPAARREFLTGDEVAPPRKPVRSWRRGPDDDEDDDVALDDFHDSGDDNHHQMFPPPPALWSTQSS